MKIIDCIRYGMDNIFKNKKKIILTILVTVSALLLVSLNLIMSNLGIYNEKMLSKTLKNGTENTKYIVINDFLMHELGKIESFYSEIGKIKGINSVSKIGHYLLEGDGLEKLINSQKLAANDSLKYSYMDKKKNNNNINNLECYYVSKDIFKLCNLTLSKGEKPTIDNLKEDYNMVYIGNDLKGIEVGEEFIYSYNNSNKVKYKVMGKLKKGNLLMAPDIGNGIAENYTINLDYEVLIISKKVSDSFVYFAKDKTADIESINNQIKNIAKEKGIHISVGSIKGFVNKEKNDRKIIQKLLLKLMILVMIIVFIILIIIQLVIINDNKFKYGVMLANGASIKDLFKIIICENVVKMILELALTWLTVILIINYYYYNYSAVLRILILNVFYVMVIWKIIVLDLIICLTAMFISVIYLRKKNSYELLGGR